MMPGCMHKKSAAKSPLPRRKQIIGFGWFGLTQIQISPSCIRRTCLRIRGKDTQFPCGFDIIKLFYDFLAFVNIFSPYSLFLPSPQPHAPRTEHRLPECWPQGILKCAGARHALARQKQKAMPEPENFDRKPYICPRAKIAFPCRQIFILKRHSCAGLLNWQP